MTDPLGRVAAVVEEARVRMYEASTNVLASPAGLALREAVWQVFTAWDGILDEVGKLPGAVATLTADPRFTPAARRAEVAKVVGEAQAACRALLDTMRTQADAVDRKLVALGVPARPTPVDATQEAHLAALKSDLRMVLDRLPDATSVVNRLVRALGDAIAAGDDLAVWLLAGSGWPALYLERFGEPGPFVASLEAETAELLDRTGSGDVAVARELLGVLRGQRGLLAAVQGAEVWLSITLSDLAGRSVVA